MAKGAIVVGAGPVGLVVAGELRLGGVDVTVYDKLPAPTGESRGVGFTRRAAEIFDQRGLLDQYGEVEWAQGHFGGVRIDFSKLLDNHFSVRGVPQSRTEEVLGAWLAGLGGTVRRGCEVVGFRETDDGVVVSYDGPEGRAEDTAQYLVGCDGARSLVRKTAGIGFPGLAASRGSHVADIVGVRTKSRPIGERVPGGMVMAFDLQDGVQRIVIHEEGVRPLQDGETLTFTEIADAWARMTGESLHHAEVLWVSTFTNATRQAAEYRRGRVFVAGDAAHIHIPAGAQGLSVGVQDAVNLGWKLAATINGWAPEGLLDTYHSERHAVGRRLLRDSLAQTLLYLTGDEMEPVRNLMRELVAIPPAAEHLAGSVSGLSIRYDVGAAGHPLLGLRVPDNELDLVDGRRVRVRELLHRARGVLVVGDGSDDVQQLADPWCDRVDVVHGRWVPVDADTRQPALESVLVRPDGYVVWATPGSGDLRAALARWFGLARPVSATDVDAETAAVA